MKHRPTRLARGLVWRETNAMTHVLLYGGPHMARRCYCRTPDARYLRRLKPTFPLSADLRRILDELEEADIAARFTCAN